jgi:hypothetical protein
MTISWNLRGIDVEVHYDLTPFDPGDYYNPPSGGYATVYGITLEDSDIDLLDLVGCNLITDLEREIYEYERESYDEGPEYEPDDD